MTKQSILFYVRQMGDAFMVRHTADAISINWASSFSLHAPQITGDEAELTFMCKNVPVKV